MFSITFPFVLPNRFTDSIKLKGIIVVGGEDGYHPNKMRLWVQRERKLQIYFGTHIIMDSLLCRLFFIPVFTISCVISWQPSCLSRQ